MRMIKALIIAMICTLLYLTVSLAEEIEIKISSIRSEYNNQGRTQKTENGIFEFRPDESVLPSGHIEVNFTVNGEPKSFKTKVKNIFKLGGDYFYYFVTCDNGNAIQMETVLFDNPFVNNIKDYNILDLNVAKQIYKNGDMKQQELAVWMVWKLDVGRQIADKLQDLVNGNVDERKRTAKWIDKLRLFHPLIIQEVQRTLHELQYKPGSIDGVLSNDTIIAIKQWGYAPDSGAPYILC